MKDVPVLRRWRRLLLGLALVFIAIWGYDESQKIYWVGGTDLEIEFVVTDAETGHPIELSSISIDVETGFYREREERHFTLQTDERGMARRVCHDNMCYGAQSGLGFTDTWGVHVPGWYFQVSSQGYEPSKVFFLGDMEYHRLVQRMAPGVSQLIVHSSMKKKRE